MVHTVPYCPTSGFQLNLVSLDFHSRGFLWYHGYYARKATKKHVWNRMINMFGSGNKRLSDCKKNEKFPIFASCFTYSFIPRPYNIIHWWKMKLIIFINLLFSPKRPTGPIQFSSCNVRPYPALFVSCPLPMGFSLGSKGGHRGAKQYPTVAPWKMLRLNIGLQSTWSGPVSHRSIRTL